MDLSGLCPPALLYVAFTGAQVLIDMMRGFYNTAFIKTAVGVIFTVTLNLLCARGLSVVSWMIVFIPFVSLTIITTLLLFTFRLHPKKGLVEVRN